MPLAPLHGAVPNFNSHPQCAQPESMQLVTQLPVGRSAVNLVTLDCFPEVSF